MSDLPAPISGLVISYSYLWKREAESGEVAGRKYRPASVLISVRQESGDLIVYVAPITHTRAQRPEDGIQIPAIVKRRLGLDDAPSWIMTNEFNAFRWPGPDIAHVGDGDLNFAYGVLPKALTDEIIRQFRRNLARNNVRVVKRTE